MPRRQRRGELPSVSEDDKRARCDTAKGLAQHDIIRVESFAPGVELKVTSVTTVEGSDDEGEDGGAVVEVTVYVKAVDRKASNSLPSNSFRASEHARMEILETNRPILDPPTADDLAHAQQLGINVEGGGECIERDQLRAMMRDRVEAMTVELTVLR